jgi:estrogen-related receptor beta like 1
VTNLTNDLSAVAEQLDEIKGNMDSRGSSMTDTSPLVKIKTALQEIKVEINTFELRIGVVGHTLLQAKMREGLNRKKRGENGGLDGGDIEIDDDDN